MVYTFTCTSKKVRKKHDMRDLYEDHENHEKTKHQKATYLSKKSIIHETHILDSV